jgi:hypothetical protein
MKQNLKHPDQPGCRVRQRTIERQKIAGMKNSRPTKRLSSRSAETGMNHVFAPKPKKSGILL